MEHEQILDASRGTKFHDNNKAKLLNDNGLTSTMFKASQQVKRLENPQRQKDHKRHRRKDFDRGFLLQDPVREQED